MTERQAMWGRIAISVAAMGFVAALAVGTVVSACRPRDGDFKSALDGLGESLGQSFDKLWCPEVDASGGSIWITVLPGSEMVASAPTKKTTPPLISGERMMVNNGAELVSAQVGAAAASEYRVAFDRPPVEGDTVDLRIRPVNYPPGEGPNVTLPKGDPLANSHHSFVFTGGRFEPTATFSVCTD